MLSSQLSQQNHTEMLPMQAKLVKNYTMTRVGLLAFERLKTLSIISYMPKIINRLKWDLATLLMNIDAQYELWGKKNPSYLYEGVCCTKNYWSLSNCRYVKVTPYMGIYIILETGIRVFFMYFLSLKSKVQKKINLLVSRPKRQCIQSCHQRTISTKSCIFIS